MDFFNRNYNFVIEITILHFFQKLEFLGSYTGQIFQGPLQAVRLGQVPQSVILSHLGSLLWINILRRKIRKRYLSTDFPISKSLTSRKINP